VAKEFRLPDIGEGLVEVEITHWHIPVGGHVGTDQPIVEVETDKITVEVPALKAGVLAKRARNEGDTVKVDTRTGEYLGRVATAG
jgi:pyruvate/2-oxoglutarate dehydrogenase complex dihydrolipoamide acyltransferase (E2) component